MSSIKNIVLKDGLATPVDHTFVPNSAQKANEPAVWLEKSAGSPLGYFRITAKVDAQTTKASKVSIVISTPHLAVSGQNCCVGQNTPQVSYTEFANLSFSLPPSSTVQTRTDILAYAKNLLANADIAKMVIDLEPAY